MVSFGTQRWPIEASPPLNGSVRNPDSGLVPIFQTVSEGVFSEVGLPLYGVLEVGSEQILRKLLTKSLRQ